MKSPSIYPRLAYPRLSVRWAAVLAVALAVALTESRSFAGTIEALRDPTRPPLVATRTPAAAAETAPVLSAIMGAPGARIAIFNGQLVHSGGTVGDYAIEAVFDDGVRYRHAGATHELHLHQGSSSKTSPKPAPAASPGVKSP
jgi:hypothetical protein